MGFDIVNEDGGAGTAIRHVELQHARLLAQRPDFIGNGLGLAAAAAAMHDQVESGARQAQGYGPANAATGAGNQNGVSHWGTPAGLLRPGSWPPAAG
ncbi:hypothetical protein D3C77_495750 [compost metagenome]